MKTRDVGGEATAVRFENPLMPDERLRQMYAAMVQMRKLEEHMSAGKGAVKIGTVRGEEAARASTALSLGAGDVISDRANAPGMDLLLGAKLGALKGHRAGKGGVRPTIAEGSALRLPPATHAEERLHMAVGAAAALKVQRGGRVLLVYMGAGEASKKEWKRVLSAAGKQELPVIFVVLPEVGEKSSKDAGELCGRSRRWGVPGFPVDGMDAIAMYRVMQESLLRGRSDGGPALIECVRFRVEGKGKQQVEDPIERLGELLLAKGVASAEWMQRTRSNFSGRRVRR